MVLRQFNRAGVVDRDRGGVIGEEMAVNVVSLNRKGVAGRVEGRVQAPGRDGVPGDRIGDAVDADGFHFDRRVAGKGHDIVRGGVGPAGAETRRVFGSHLR